MIWTKEAEDVKKRWQEYTEQLYKNLQDPDNHNGVITHLERDILECEVKWALGNITMKLVEVMEFQLSCFKSEDDIVTVLHSICQQIWKTQQWLQDWKRIGFRSNPKERQCQRMFRLLHNCTHLIR